MCNVGFVGFFCSNVAALERIPPPPPTVLFTLGRYWHRQVSSQLSLHHALYMCSSQTDERKMVGERDESMGEKKEAKG